MQFTVQDASTVCRKDACKMLGHLARSQLVIKMRAFLELVNQLKHLWSRHAAADQPFAYHCFASELAKQITTDSGWVPYLQEVCDRQASVSNCQASEPVKHSCKNVIRNNKSMTSQCT